MASSRVGHMMRTCVSRLVASMRSTAGRPKARVLPDPVWLWPTTSRPVRATGMAWAWMGEGCSKPWAAMAFINSAERPRSANVFSMDVTCRRVGFRERATCRSKDVSYKEETGSPPDLAGYMSNFGPKWGSGKKPVSRIPRAAEIASGDCEGQVTAQGYA
jgi:hypothetical protein